MSATKASFEQVQKAVLFLQRHGEKPSASRVRDLLNGGSKTTILGHMQTLYAQIAAQPRASEMAEAFMMKTATKLIEEVWAEATRMASPELENRLKTLGDLNEALSEGLQDLVAENKALEERIASLEADLRAAEEKAAVADSQLVKRGELDFHMTELSVAVNLLKRGLPERPALQQAIQLVADVATAMDREELHRRMLALGYPNRSARQARKNMVENGYVEEKGEPPLLYLLPAGERRLAKLKTETGGEKKGAAA